MTNPNKNNASSLDGMSDDALKIDLANDFYANVAAGEFNEPDETCDDFAQHLSKEDREIVEAGQNMLRLSLADLAFSRSPTVRASDDQVAAVMARINRALEKE